MFVKNIIPFLISLLGIIITIVVAQTLVSNERQHIKAQIQLEAKNIALGIQSEIISQILALSRMAHRWEVGGKPSRLQWESDAENYIKHSQLYQAIGWVAPSFHVRWIFPLKGNEQAQDLDLSFEEKRKNTLEKARNLREVKITPPLDLVQGGKGILIDVPIYHKDIFEGFIAGVFNIEKLLNQLLDKDASAKNFSFRLFNGNDKIYSGHKSINVRDTGWIINQPVTFYNVNWNLEVGPNPEFLDTERSQVSRVVLTLGILMALFLGIIFYFAIRAKDKSHEVEASNRRLRNEIAERKRIKEALQNAHDDLEHKVESRTKELNRSNKELQDFAHIASHDLQEPLRKIITLGDRLDSKVPATDEQARDYLARMQNSALRMQRLIQDLLQFTKIETKAKPFEATDLNEVVEGVLDDLEVRVKETAGVVNIKHLPVVQADPLQMHQLFLNLVGNSLKYHREGVSPVVNLDTVLNENGMWEITVDDNGIGINEKHVDRVFQPFERLHNRSTYEGTGIGLTICNKIVTRHGGAINIKRKSKNGVTFHILLPKKIRVNSNLNLDV